jgi:hypothetical protein
MQMTAQWTRAELLGYLATWSATQRLTKAVGEKPYRDLCDAVAARWPEDERREVTWPLAIRLARR